jgi:hypothetical protein
MTTKEVLAAMSKGAMLCKEYDRNGPVFWLEPRRIIIRSDIAERVIACPGIVPGGDRLFTDAAPQTWHAQN